MLDETMFDLQHATSDQIEDYKKTWLNKSYNVQVDSTMDVKGKSWCRHNLNRWNWSFTPNTTSNKHTFFFEHESTSEQFKLEILNM